MLGTSIRYLIGLLTLILVVTFVPKTVIAEDKLTPEFEVIQNEAIQAQEELRLKQIEEEKIKAYSAELTKKAESLVGSKQGQCVLAARRFLFGNENLGREHIHGYVQTKINSHDPVVGSFIVIHFSSGWKHTGITLFTTEEGWVYYYDSNGSLNGRAAIRSINLRDKQLKGFHDVNKS